jgi:hypothetical protein
VPQAAHSLSLLCFRTPRRSTSEKGHSRRFGYGPATSGLPPLTDMLTVHRHVSNVPETDSCTAAKYVLILLICRILGSGLKSAMASLGDSLRQFE